MENQNESEAEAGGIFGTLLLPSASPRASAPPASFASIPLALIIAGSGPTDRDGNSALTRNDSLRLLAQALAHRGIASLRYDKRGIGKSAAAMTSESDLRFEQYADDAAAWIAWARDCGFAKIAVVGHSEGSLIGMLAAQRARIEAFVSIAGPGEAADRTLRRQLQAQGEAVAEACAPLLDALVAGKTVEAPREFYALFRPSVQPYMISWFRYDPQREIQKIGVPVLIVQGTTDIQVGVEDAERLHAANARSRLAVIEGMNHLFKAAPADRAANIATYRQPELPIKTELVDALADFLNGG